jgi:hypothetical protein
MIPTPASEGSPAESITLESRPSPHQSKRPACILCQQRKVKCDRKSPCSHCVKAQAECQLQSGLRKRKKRFAEAELLERLRRYEVHLKAYGADLNAINEGVQPVKEKNTIEETAEEPEAMTSLSVRRSLRGLEK